MSIRQRCSWAPFFIIPAFILIFCSAIPAWADDPPPTSPYQEEPQGSGMISQAGIDHLGFTGASSSRLPILVPPGRGGIAPALSLTYNSFGQNGPIGVGWTLDPGSIERASKRGVDYSGNDFVAGGADELVPRSDWGSNYYGSRLEGGYAKYYRNSGTGGWVVTTKQGLKQYYGTTSASRQDNAYGIFKWCLDRVEDTNGNYMTVSYTKDQGEIYIDRIEYTGHTSGLSPSNSVQFVYETRNDAPLMYRIKSAVRTAKRLKTIEIRSLNNELARKYELAYSYSPASGRSLLSHVYQYGTDNVSWQEVLNLTWQQGGYDQGTRFNIAGGQSVTVLQSTYRSRSVLLDYDGDGRMDIIFYGHESNGYSYFSLLKGMGDGTYSTQYEATGGIPGMIEYFSINNPYSVTTLDYNGDGKTDLLLYRGNGTVVLAQSEGQGSFTRVYDSADYEYECHPHGDDDWCGWYLYDQGVGGFILEPMDEDEYGNPVLGANVTPFDYNGDGKMDLLIHNIGPNRLGIVRSNGDATFTKVYDSDEQPQTGMLTENGSITTYVPLDYDGDGKSDFFVYTRGYPRFALNRSNGDGTFTNVVFGSGIANFGFGYSNQEAAVSFDYNGDGKADILLSSPGTGRLTVAKSTGNGDFVPEYESTSGLGNVNMMAAWDRVVPLDYSGDGMADLLLYRSGQGLMTLARSDGNGNFTAEYTSSSGLGSFPLNGYSDYILGADGSGDGKADLLMIQTGFGLGYFRSALSLGNTPDLLATVTNEFGGTTTLTYGNSTNYQNTFLPFNVHPVLSISVNDGMGNISTAGYTYAYGFYDYADRAYRGFGYIKKTVTDGSYSETWYNQDDYFKGKINTVRSRTPGGFLFAETNYTWYKTVLDSQYDVNAVQLTMMQSFSYNSDSTYVWSQEDYVYDTSNGNLLTKTTSGTDAENTVSHYQYANYGDWVWRPTQTTLETASSTILRATLNQYESGTGNLLHKESWLNGGTNPSVSMTYDQYGNVETVTDPMNQVTTTEYDLATRTFPVKTTAPQTGTVTHIIENPEYDYRFGKATQAKGENGNITYYTYDVFGRPYGVEYPNGGESTVLRYDGVFPRYSIAKVKENATGQTIDQYTYIDGLGRKIEMINIGEGGSSIVTRVLYDTMGRNYRTEGPFFGSGTQFSQTPPADYPWQETSYDDRGRPVATTTPRPNGEAGTITSTISYSGLSTTVTDPDGAMKTNRKDYLGRLIQVTEYPETGPQTTSYTYNVAGDPLTTVDCLGNTTTITYDTLGRKVNMTDPDMGFVQYFYNASGKITQQIDAKNNTISFTYDELGRVKTKTYSSGELTVTYTYDNPSIPNGKGRLASITNTTATTTINAYDSMGKTTSVTETIDGDPANYTTQYAYDLSGKQTTITYPDNYQVGYSYYAGTGLLQDVTGITDQKTYAHYSLYEPSGKIGQVDLGNGTSTRYSYDSRTTRLFGIVTMDPSGLPANDIQNMSYAYTPAGDILQITDNKRGITSTYLYDLLHRLVSETHDGNYAPRADTLEYGYGTAHPHAVQNISLNGAAFSHTYDPNGNMVSGFDYADSTSIGTRTIVYNADDKPTRITYVKGGNTAIVDFYYDGEGKRAKKAVQGGSTTYYIGGHYEIKDGVAAKHIFAGSMAIARITGSTIYYYHKDHLGSSTAMTDANGQVVETTTYMPFGQTREHTGTSVTGYLYTDQELDPETGLYYYGARYYDPTLGLFISADTIVQNFSDPQTLNRYSYARNNPLIYTDPSGNFFIEAVVIGAAVGALTSAATGGDIWQGALTGAISGAMFYGAGSLVIAEGLQGTMAAVGIHAATGALSGAVSAGITGGDIGMGMLIGGLSAGVAEYGGDKLFGAGGVFANLEKGSLSAFAAEFTFRTAVGGAMGGVGAELAGGDFGSGFVEGAKTAAVGYLCNQLMHISIDKGKEIVRVAKSWLGVPYNADGPFSRKTGTDCSHLVNDVYKEAGLFYPYRSTSDIEEILSKYFTKVTTPPREGDMVLYKSHMGIYTDGKIISAQSGAGKVTLGELDWFRNFKGFYRFK